MQQRQCDSVKKGEREWPPPAGPSARVTGYRACLSCGSGRKRNVLVT
jgi:hypothetical protein